MLPQGSLNEPEIRASIQKEQEKGREILWGNINVAQLAPGNPRYENNFSWGII
jgi:hypothetical protein